MWIPSGRFLNSTGKSCLASLSPNDVVRMPGSNQPRRALHFYFEVKSSGLSTLSYYAIRPNAFVPVHLDANSNTREVTVSQANAFGTQSGTMDKASRAFSYEKIAPGVYKVTPKSDSVDGECGFYKAAGVSPGGGARILDFGIKLTQ